LDLTHINVNVSHVTLVQRVTNFVTTTDHVAMETVPVRQLGGVSVKKFNKLL